MAVLPFTQHALNKLESLFKDLGFKVRYEKGSFKTGACLLQNSKVIVVNKFLDIESRINSLIEILVGLNLEQIHTGSLDDKQKEFMLLIKQKSLEI